MKRIISVILLACLCLFAFGCSKSDEGGSASDYSNDKNPTVTIAIEGYGTIYAELYPEIAPETVNNFIYLINSGFYNGNTIHRVAKDFVIQGGDPTGTSSGTPGYNIKGEFKANGVDNPLTHERGVLSMARRSDGYDTAGCQFFIMLTDYHGLDGQYAAFGRITGGMDIVDKIASDLGDKVTDSRSGKLIENLTITEMTVDTKGVEYPEPTKLN